MTVQIELQADVQAAIASIDDPEYPGVSIVDLGLVESLSIKAGGIINVGLIPTFSGCPALAIIAQDVTTAIQKVEGVGIASVRWLRSPIWTPDRLSKRGRETLATEFTVAVQIGNRRPKCPRCGSPTVESSMFGPSRCRSVNRCTSCNETVEVLRA